MTDGAVNNLANANWATPGPSATLGMPSREPANPSGITPTEFKVLIDPKAVEAKVGSIIIPDMTQDREKFAQIKGRIVARSPHAFSYATQAEWDAVGATKPGPGDIVIYAKYAGVRVKGKDGNEYLVINDKDICAVLDE